MAFVRNSYEQFSLHDSTRHLTERQRELLRKSWAVPFAEEIFPRIDEKRFAPFYSSRSPKPNAPVNVVVGAILLQELLDLTAEEIVEAASFDVRIQVALHTTSYEVQPFSVRTLQRFRERNERYRKSAGEDLLGSCLDELKEILLEDSRYQMLTRRIRGSKGPRRGTALVNRQSQ